MQCPLCNVELKILDRMGVEIDYCPKCRGMWLDRGELDVLVEQLAGKPGKRSKKERSIDGYRPFSWRDEEDEYAHANREPRRPKRKSILGQLLDFD